jgi:hypothetical protein
MDHRQELENTYADCHTQIASIMADIEEQFNNLPIPENVKNWGTVGDLNYVLNSLKPTLDKLKEINGVTD